MADKKISQLPAATTPLAGTEVLPIVQGGTTDQVSVANLTAGRTVNASSIVTTGNSGIGTTPKSWGSVFRALDLGTAPDQSNFIAGYSGAEILIIGSGVYHNGSNWVYAGSTKGAVLSASQGTFSFSTAPTGTAGNNATFTEILACNTVGNNANGYLGGSFKLKPIAAADAQTESLYVNTADGKLYFKNAGGTSFALY